MDKKKNTFSIACPYVGEFDYDFRVYKNLREELEKLGFFYTQNSGNNRIYFLGWPAKKHYQDIFDIDPAVNNVLWLYGHPDRVNLRWIRKFGSNLKFFTSSKFYQQYLLERFRISSDVLVPASSLTKQIKSVDKNIVDLAFVGIHRKRPIIEKILPIVKKYNLSLEIYGVDWNKYQGTKAAIKYWVGNPISYDLFPELATRAKIVLVDHHKSMNKVGIASHKYIDFLMSGAFLISDDNKDVEQTYKGIVYKSSKDLEEKIMFYLSDDKARDQVFNKQISLVQNTHSTEFIAKKLAMSFI